MCWTFSPCGRWHVMGTAGGGNKQVTKLGSRGWQGHWGQGQDIACFTLKTSMTLLFVV